MAQQSFIQASKLVDLLTTATIHGDQPVWVLAPDQLGLGSDRLKPHSIIDLATEAVRTEVAAPPKPERQLPSPTVSFLPSPKASRQTGKYLAEVRGQTIECTSLKHLLGEGLRALENEQPGTLDKLSRVKKRTKRIVARNPGELFDQPELSAKYAERLSDAWWYGTNNSAAETKTWLERGCEIAGLRWGTDFRMTL